MKVEPFELFKYESHIWYMDKYKTYKFLGLFLLAIVYIKPEKKSYLIQKLFFCKTST